MNIHEYQGKQIFARYGIPISQGIPAFTLEEAETAAKKIIADTGSEICVIKAQIHAGGRGLGGGVKVCKGLDAAKKAASEILGMQLVTHQTGPKGQKVNRIYVEQGQDIARELYIGMVVDRDSRRVALMASTEGGMEIEVVAEKSPEKIITEYVDPLLGLTPFQARKIAFALDVGKGTAEPKKTIGQFVKVLLKLSECFIKEDCSLCEVNPMVITGSGGVVALDSKITFDSNAEARHKKEWAELLDTEEEDPVELEAKEVGLSYVALDGNIGCLVNGAGLAMSTMDIIKHYGGEPANFLDVGGGATKEMVTKAFKMILSSSKVKGIFVNIFGGIMRCDVVAEGVVAATKELGLKVPLVVRLAGTNVEEGKKILNNSGLKIEAADSMGDGAQKIVAAVKAAG